LGPEESEEDLHQGFSESDGSETTKVHVNTLDQMPDGVTSPQNERKEASVSSVAKEEKKEEPAAVADIDDSWM